MDALTDKEREHLHERVAHWIRQAEAMQSQRDAEKARADRWHRIADDVERAYTAEKARADSLQAEVERLRGKVEVALRNHEHAQRVAEAQMHRADDNIEAKNAATRMMNRANDQARALRERLVEARDLLDAAYNGAGPDWQAERDTFLVTVTALTTDDTARSTDG